MNSDRVLITVGLTLWFGAQVAAAGYVGRRMRFPKSRFAPNESQPMATKVIGALVGFGLFATGAFSAPNVTLIFDVFSSGVIAYFLLVFAVSLTVERRRAQRLGLPEPGTAGTVSMAESVVFLAIALPFALAALFLTVYGIANELSRNGGEGMAGLGLGAIAWFIAIAMGLYGFAALRMQRSK